MKHYYVGLDLGQAGDFTALSVLQRVNIDRGEPYLEAVGMPTGSSSVQHRGPETARRELQTDEAQYHLRHLERFQLGTSYPAIVERTKELMQTPALQQECICIVDATGVGRPVVDLMRKEGIKDLVPVTITGGKVATAEQGGWHVPKRDLATNLQVLFQNKRLKIAEGLCEAATFVRELQNFKVKINLATGHDTYEAWREGEHDDLVLSVALACWYAERDRRSPPRKGSVVYELYTY